MSREMLIHEALNKQEFAAPSGGDLREESATAFPGFVRNLPRADYSKDGGEAIRGYVVQGAAQQVVFNENDEALTFRPHRHAQSFGIVLEGECRLVIAGIETIHRKGDVYHVPAGIEHYAWQSAGYRDIVIFDEPTRVEVKHDR